MISEATEMSPDGKTTLRRRPVYFVMELKAEIFKQAAEQIRHGIFVDELGWVNPQVNQRDCCGGL